MTLARTAMTMARGTAAKVTWETMVTRATKEMRGGLKKVLAQVLCCFCECQSNVLCLFRKGSNPEKAWGSLKPKRPRSGAHLTSSCKFVGKG